MVAAKVFPGVTVTIGNDPDTVKAIEKLGSKHANKAVTEVCIDTHFNVVTSPAYMYGEAAPHQVFDGIQSMVQETLRLVKH